MTKFIGFMIILMVAALAYLAFLNVGVVTIKLTDTHVYEIPKIALILFSIVVGALSMLAIGAVRDARRYIENLRHLRQHKKELKTQEYYSKGLDAFFASRYDEATEFFKRVLENDPDNVNSLLRRGDITFDNGDMVRARDFYMKAKEIRPQSVEALFSLEKVFESEKKWQEALRYLNNILDIDGENPKALYRKRDIYEMSSNWEDILEVQYSILKSDITPQEKQEENKKLIGYRYEQGLDHLEKGDLDRAKKVFKAVIKLDKNFVAAYLALAESYLNEGKTDRAEEVLVNGYEETSAIVFLVRLEDFFITAGEPGRIIDLYQKAIQKSPGEPKLQFFLAKLYYRLEMIDYAYEAVMSIDTTTIDYPDLHILLGNIYVKRMQQDNAIEEFKKSLHSDKPQFIPFCCTNCDYASKDWVGRCPECKKWNTLSLDVSGTCKI